MESHLELFEGVGHQRRVKSFIRGPIVVVKDVFNWLGTVHENVLHLHHSPLLLLLPPLLSTCQLLHLTNEDVVPLHLDVLLRIHLLGDLLHNGLAPLLVLGYVLLRSVDAGLDISSLLLQILIE